MNADPDIVFPMQMPDMMSRGTETTDAFADHCFRYAYDRWLCAHTVHAVDYKSINRERLPKPRATPDHFRRPPTNDKMADCWRCWKS